MTTLGQRFIDLCLAEGLLISQAETLWTELEARYTEPVRAYHNLQHIDFMLTQFDRLGVSQFGLELAIWFHDLIYNPKRNDNEAKSAQAFQDQFPTVNKALRNTVHRLILATDPCKHSSGQADEDLIIDIDLAILGSAPSCYQTYCKAIRQEYSFVDQVDFINGRVRILENFLTSPIYCTDAFKHLENQAIKNIHTEIRHLNQQNV